MKTFICLAIVTVCLGQSASAQIQEPEKKTIVDPSRPNLSPADRARKVVDALQLKNESTRTKVHAILLQYLDSQRVVFAIRKKGMDDAKTNSPDNKELADARATSAWAKASGEFNKMQAAFLGRLSTLLSSKEIDKLKDLLTENGVKREFDNYIDLFPNLTQAQRKQVMAYLLEARENAMNGETVENRVDWFIKFRGRANNYLAAAGYNLRKATEAQEKREKN